MPRCFLVITKKTKTMLILLRIGKQSISYRLFDIHIHYRNETDSSSHTEKYM